jgi:nucleotide-binding universal stress UspA family protein
MMIKLDKILFPTDYSHCADIAFDYAVQLAFRYGARLQVLNVSLPFEKNAPCGDTPEEGREHIRSLLAGLQRRRAPGHLLSLALNHDCVILEKARGISAAEVILGKAYTGDADLIVMGTHGRHGLERLFLGSVAESVVRNSVCPVLTVRGEQGRSLVEGGGRLLAPVDFSEHSRNALRHARVLAASLHMGLDVLYVIREIVQPGFYAPGSVSIHELEVNYVGRAESSLEEFYRETSGPDVDAALHVLEGRISNSITTFARDHGCEMIVMSTHGFTGMRHLLLGSVAERVVRTAACPVFTVKAFGRSLVAEESPKGRTTAASEHGGPQPGASHLSA